VTNEADVCRVTAAGFIGVLVTHFNERNDVILFSRPSHCNIAATGKSENWKSNNGEFQ
jgi:hypothetical protein